MIYVPNKPFLTAFSYLQIAVFMFLNTSQKKIILFPVLWSKDVQSQEQHVFNTKFKTKCGLEGYCFVIFEIIKIINFYKIDKFINVSIDELKNNIPHVDDAFNGFI